MSDERYDRQTHLPGWDQGRLARATVVVMGMGALGNAVAQALALAGVGRLILCDMDRIERSNLSRTPLFRESDIGRAKVEAAAERLLQLAPGIQIDARVERLEHGVGLGELKDAALTLGCLDSRAARLELAGRCALVAAPWIDGATGQWSGEVRPYLDPAGPCFGCGMEDAVRAESDAPHSCRVQVDAGHEGATAPLSLLVGSHMALLAVRFLMGLPVDGAIKVVDGESGLVTAVWQKRDNGCPFHRALPIAVRVPLSNRSTVKTLRAVVLLLSSEVALAWQPFQVGAKCRHCEYSDARCGRVARGACPQCGAQLRILTHLELDQAAADTPLHVLGIPPREIVAVRSGAEIRYIQLGNSE